jgi:hypothetical protein
MIMGVLSSIIMGKQHIAEKMLAVNVFVHINTGDLAK